MATAYKDYYQTLGVDKNASQKDIKTAYRKLARKYHPDVNKEAGAEAKFKEINEANEVLSDPEKRKKYDQLGPQWEAYERAAAAGGMPFGDFGQGRGGRPQVEYRSMSSQEMEDLFGDQNPFSDFFYSVFGDGGGAGSFSSFSTGGGRNAFGTRTGGGRPRGAPALQGADVEGETDISLEEAYRGTSRTVELDTGRGSRKVEVKIPPGIRSGARVRAAGQGTSGQGGGRAGDLYIRVNVGEDPRFTRVGDDVTTRVDAPLDVMLLGGEVEVPTLKGTRVHLKIPPETQDGRKMRLRGMGMPKLKGGGHGDLIAEVHVHLPVPMSAEVKEWAESHPGHKGKSRSSSKDN
ncbi:MAG: DnaJ domain-containing protein [Candidatus Dormibacteraeota bacterium]|nr:DnaJ domain-containing protein [Candidatus Dormibacteraeota bacterium]